MIDVTELLGNLAPLLATSKGGLVREGTSSVTLDAGQNATDFSQGVRVYGHRRRVVSEGIRFRLTQERRPETTGAEGSWFNFGLCRPRSTLVRYIGPTDDVAFAAALDWGWRITMANFNSVSPGISSALRIRTWPSRTALAPVQEPVVVPFEVGHPYDVLIRWGRGVVSCSIGHLMQSWRSPSLLSPKGPIPVLYASPGTRYRVEAA